MRQQQSRLFCRTLGCIQALYRICSQRHGEAVVPIFIGRGAPQLSRPLASVDGVGNGRSDTPM
jgi:hypothetical protein